MSCLSIALLYYPPLDYLAFALPLASSEIARTCRNPRALYAGPSPKDSLKVPSLSYTERIDAGTHLHLQARYIRTG